MKLAGRRVDPLSRGCQTAPCTRTSKAGSSTESWAHQSLCCSRTEEEEGKDISNKSPEEADLMLLTHKFENH